LMSYPQVMKKVGENHRLLNRVHQALMANW
jgi:hypothetical protein